MKRATFMKCSITLGLVLLFVLFLPLPISDALYHPITAKASSTENDQNDVKLNVTSKSLVIGDHYTLKVYNLSDNDKVTFKSEDTSIVSIDKDGEMIAKDNVGETTITVTVKNGFRKITSIECKVTVGPPAQSISMLNSEKEIGVGKKRNLYVFLKPKNTVEEAKFKSSDESIARVTQSGKVIAVSPGKAIITATIDNGASVTCVITVVSGATDGDE